MNSKLTAVVLAGGVGTRFWPISADKNTFPWFGKPFLEHSVAQALPKEVSKIVVITNPINNDTLKSVHFGRNAVTVIQRAPLGMADAILTAAEEIKDSPLLIINGDDITDKEFLSDVVAFTSAHRVFGVIPAFKSDTYFPGGYVITDETGKVREIVEKPGPGNEPGNFIAMLGHYIADSNELIEELRQTKSGNDDVYEKALSKLMKRHDFQMFHYEKPFASLKYPWNILDVTHHLLRSVPSHRGKDVVIKDNVIIEGNVFLDDNVKIFENTKIVGPCYIGKDTIIGNNNMIRESHIGAHCVTGFNSDISRSYIGDHCWFHSNYIGDSVLEGNVSMGAGAALANLRLDDGVISSHVQKQPVATDRNKLGAIVGANTRIGVNSSIMPGVKIGRDSFIGSGVVLDRDLPEQSFCIVKGAYTITRNRTPVSSMNRENFRKRI